MKKECRNCRHYLSPREYYGEGEDYGQCRRYPPRFIPEQATAEWVQNIRDVEDPDEPPAWLMERGVWPRTDNEDWCGEFQPRMQDSIVESNKESTP